VTHSTRRFQPAFGLQRPLWFVHQWHCGAALHMSLRKISASHSAAHRGLAKTSAAATQYCGREGPPHHEHEDRIAGAVSQITGRVTKHVAAQSPAATLQYCSGHHELQVSDAPQ
jgi:hypothetical protein